MIDNGLEWRCIAFEPQRHRLEERATAESAPPVRLVLIDAFIGDGSEGRFHCVNEDGSSSLLDLNRTFCSQFNDLSRVEVVSTEHVSTRTLDDLLAAEPYVDFLKFDIQGFEARALEGASQILERTNVVHCEVFFGPMYVESAYFRDIDRVLVESGFRFVDFSHLNRYEYTSVEKRTSKEGRLVWVGLF